MNRIIRSVLSVALLFCMICSLSGVAFAMSWDEWLESIDYGNNWPPSSEPSLPLDHEPPEISVEPSEEPAPLETFTDFDDSVPFASEFIDSGVADIPGGDTPALDPSDVDSTPPDLGDYVPVLPPDVGDSGLPGASEGDNTYIVLPDDFIITSSGYDDTMAIDPYSLAPVTPSNTSGLKSVLLSILGNYDPIVAQYQYQNGSNYGYIREIQPDYVWLVSAAIFAILLYCTWRLLGGLICRQ